MGIWVELRCERRGGDMERPRELLCWSDINGDPGVIAQDSVNGLREAYLYIKQAAHEAGWKMIRGEGWVCPCCLQYELLEVSDEA